MTISANTSSGVAMAAQQMAHTTHASQKSSGSAAVDASSAQFKKQVASPGKALSQKVSPQVMSLFVNMIKELLGLLRPNPDVSSGFSLAFPALPSYRDNKSNGEPMFKGMASLPSMTAGKSAAGAGGAGDMRTPDGQTALKLPPLPSFASPATDSVSAAGSSRVFNPPSIPTLATGTGNGTPSATGASAPAASGTSRVLRVAPLPSFVSPTTGSLSTRELPKAFNPPAIPSLTGGSTALPTVNASGNATATTAATGTAASTSSRVLRAAPLPSFVSPTTGSLSTRELPKAFNPPAIPSLTGGRTALPNISTNTSPVNTGGRVLNALSLPGLSASVQLVNPTSGNTGRALGSFVIPSLAGNSGSLVASPSAATTTSNIPSLTPAGGLQTGSSPSRAHVFLPSLSGNGGTSGTGASSGFDTSIPSLAGNNTLAALSSEQGFSLTGVNQLVDGSGSAGNKPSRGNHFK